MASKVYQKWKTQIPSSEKNHSTASPACGRLQCLCRPRFFAGQLLSEQDLNRLDCYILEKHKLHNRHVHGWGVACGLEVRCHPCEDHYVTVGPGYALSPCGEDIVVCEEDTVDVCELINKCREKERSQDPCRPYSYSPDCPEEEEDWVLAIRYDERPERGMTALRHVSSSCHKSHEEPKMRRDTPPQCEPTAVCESYRYEVFRAPSKDPIGDGSKWPHGEMIDRMVACIDNLTSNLPEMSEEVSHEITSDPNIGDTVITLDSVDEIEIGQLLNIGGYPHEEFVVVQGVDGPAKTVSFMPALSKDFHSGIFLRIVDMDARYDWCCNFKYAIAQYVKENPGYNCQYQNALNNITCPDPKLSALEFKDTWIRAFEELANIFTEVFLSCICSNLLPPCPQPTDEPRVPLAVVTIGADVNRCRVQQVCTWPNFRKFLTTFPNLQYWLSWLPVMWFVRLGLQSICCDPRQFLGDWQKKYPKYFEPSQNFSMMAFKAFTHKPMSSEAIFRGIRGEKDSKGEPILSTLELASLPQFIMINQLARPLASGMLPKQTKQFLKDLDKILPRGLADVESILARGKEIDILTSQLQELKKSLKAQEEKMKKVDALLKKRK